MALAPRLVRAFLLIGAALAIFAVPTAWEGPVLVSISEGHAIAVADALAIAPLICGTALLYWSLWRDRAQAVAQMRERPAQALLFAFSGGVGLGLLFASAFSSWFWWWAVGAVLFGAALISACLLAARAPVANARTGGVQ
jgi:hypothetical protein